MWLPYPLAIRRRLRPAAFLRVRGLKTIYSYTKLRIFNIQPFLLVIKNYPLGNYLFSYRVFIYTPLNIKRGGSASPTVLIYLISITYSYLPIITLSYYLVLRKVSTFITYSLLILNPNLLKFQIFKGLQQYYLYSKATALNYRFTFLYNTLSLYNALSWRVKTI